MGETMTPAAPSSMARRAKSPSSFKPGLLTPTMMGTRPATRFKQRSTKASDSSAESFGASPMTPRMVTPSTPQSR
jgi:hypothetical protein